MLTTWTDDMGTYFVMSCGMVRMEQRHTVCIPLWDNEKSINYDVTDCDGRVQTFDNFTDAYKRFVSLRK
jgi:hypothetical protein